MRALLLFGSLLASIPCVATSQVLLNAGDSFTFEFTHFDHQGGGLPGPNARVGFDFLGFSGSDRLRFDAFEDNPTQTAIYSTTLSAGAGSPDFTFGAAWQDMQGTFRVTMLSGAATLQEFFGSVITASGELYSLKVSVVPEPSAWSLLGAIGVPALVWAQSKSQKPMSRSRTK